MTHKWNYQPITPEQVETSQKLAQELGISPILSGLLVQRGITKAQDAKKFFRPQLPDLHDPFLMKDMDVAVERLNKAMGKKERILIYGDYDVDGTTEWHWSTSLFNSSIRTLTITSPTATTKPTLGLLFNCFNPWKASIRFSPMMGTMSEAILTATRSSSGMR